jgi:hypothetical protein
VTAYRVAEGTQLNHEGCIYGGGSTVHAEPHAASTWLSAGWVTEATTAKRVPTRTIEDKAAKAH